MDHGRSELGKASLDDVKKTALLLTLLLLIWPGLLPPAVQTDEPVVRAVLFWSETCPHCHVVINETLPPLQAI